jgi:hypothetical protein
MRMILSWLTAVALAGNGLFMLTDPAAWYGVVPGVADTGPFNAHFVRDIGCAYAVAGGSLAALALDARARPAAFAGGLFLALHALVHVFDAIHGAEGRAHWIADVALVAAPAGLVLWLGLPPPFKPGEYPC